jgi:hypothetical protein
MKMRQNLTPIPAEPLAGTVKAQILLHSQEWDILPKTGSARAY